MKEGTAGRADKKMKKRHRTTMYAAKWTLFGILVITLSAQAQPDLPVRPYRPDELVSLNRNIPLETALQILSTYAQTNEGRILVYSKLTGLTKPIGVSVENMHWKRALEYILRSNMLKFTMYEKHYEIEPLQESESPAAEEGAIDFETREVEINAVFFQADYATVYELGIDWSTFKDGTVGISTQGATNVAQEFLRISSGRQISGRVRVDALLKAFESRNRGEIIARPHVRVMEGEQGKIKVGKNFFLTLQDFAGNTRFSEYEAGIILSVTPEIYGRGDSTFIYLDINAERSDVVPDAVGVTKNITESKTRVLLLNGEETVIAGLFSHEKTNLRKGVPFLKDLPPWFFGLRYLFGYESKGYTKKELVIFIRARVVPPLYARHTGRRVHVREYLEAQRRDVKRNFNSKTRRTKRRR